jgi:hypothetical protein
MSAKKTVAKKTAERRDRSLAGKRKRAELAARARDLPAREWDRGTELVRMFMATGMIKDVRPQSLLLVSDPGMGKTELLDRFRINRLASYHSDLTVRQFYPILKQAKNGMTTHIVAPEFQKMFQRKLSVAENLLGTLVLAMEDGVNQVSVGPMNVDFGGARVGLIGAITHGTIAKKKEYLGEMGFLSRAATFPWALPRTEQADILSRISNGDRSDMEPVRLELPTKPLAVAFDPVLSRQIEKYTLEREKGDMLRPFNRLRALTQAVALLDGRDRVMRRDVEWILAFAPYWERMIDG